MTHLKWRLKFVLFTSTMDGHNSFYFSFFSPFLMYMYLSVSEVLPKHIIYGNQYQGYWWYWYWYICL